MDMLVGLLPIALFVGIFYFVMGRFIKKRSPATAENKTLPIQTSIPKAVRHWSNEDDETEVVGESKYHTAIAKIAGNAKGTHANKTCIAFLVPEKGNPYDKNAVMVMIEGVQVGYLSRTDAADFRERLKAEGIAGATTSCEAHIGWGGEGRDGKKLSYSVTLRVASYSD